MVRARSIDNALGRLLASAPVPIYALDERRRIVYCNVACGELLGIDPDELVGKRCEYRVTDSGTTSAEIAASLCPPPEVFAGVLVSVGVKLLHSSGQLVSRTVDYVPLGEDPLHCVGVLAMVYEADASRARRSHTSESAELHQRLMEVRRIWMSDRWVDELIGTSPAIQQVRDQIELASRGRTRVLVYGPSGSGREHVARLLHRRTSPDRLGQLVPLCCPLLDAELLQATITTLVRQADSLAQDLDAGEQVGRRPPTLLLLEVDQLVDKAQGELAGFLSLPGFELYSIATSERSLVTMAQEGAIVATGALSQHTHDPLASSLAATGRHPLALPVFC